MRVPVRVERIRREEALRYLGWKGKCSDPHVLSQLEEAERLALAQAEPAVVMQRFPLTKTLLLEGTTFTPVGDNVAALLMKSREAVLLAATLGMSSERLLLRTQATSAAAALVLDAVLTAMIEQVCDEACRTLEEELRGQGLCITPRFSPGYGDMPLEQTAQICTVLNTHRQIGLTVSSSGLMIPRKSVTAILGITDETPHIPSGCAVCRMASTCHMKNNGAQGCAATEE